MAQTISGTIPPKTPGGNRPGSGRKPLIARDLLNRVLDKVLDEQAVEELFTGLINISKDETLKASDRMMATRDLLAYRFGKPASTQIIEGGENPITINSHSITEKIEEEEVNRRLLEAAAILNTNPHITEEDNGK